MGLSQPKNIFFDVSGILLHLSHSNTYTGIQRVLTSVLAELVNTPNIYICWVRRGSNGYSCAKLDGFHRDDLLDLLRLQAAFHLSGGKRGVFPPLRRYARNKRKYYFHSAKLWVSNLIGKERSFIRLGTSSQKWRVWRRGVVEAPILIQKDFFDVAQAGDSVMVIDAFWAVSALANHLKRADERGIKIKQVVHDLIPLTMPTVVPGPAPRLFYENLRESLAYVSEYLAVSQFSAADMRNFLAAHGADHKVTVVPLAQEKLSSPEQGKTTTDSWLKTDHYALLKAVDGFDDVLRSLAGTRYVLTVGTVEARKNHWRLLHAWDLLIKTLPHEQVPRLVIAGRKGWTIDDFERFLDASGYLNGFVTRIEAPSDAELDFLYRHCLFTVMPSLYEGWGLPVGESLSYGRTAVVANNSSLPEVGGDLVHYCDAQSVTSIMEACKDLITQPELLAGLEAKIATANLRQWRDVANDFVAVAAR